MEDKEKQKLDFLSKDIIKSRNYREVNGGYSHLRVLLMGETGAGKTRISRTAIKPIHIDSFDKEGTITVQDMIESGDVVADISFENENPFKPEMFSKWRQKLQERLANGYFEYFGTYMLDSYTFWSRCCMNNVLVKTKRVGEVPQFNIEYPILREDMLNALDLLRAIPCDVIMTGHLEFTPDESNTNSRWRLVTVGKTAPLVLGQFSEKWIARTRTEGGKILYTIQTAPVDNYVASTRIGNGGVLDIHEKPDIKAIRAKAGWPIADKPPLKTLLGD